MHKHGVSHGLAVLVNSIIAAFIVELLRPHMSKIINAIDSVSNTLATLFKINFPPGALTIIIIAVFLSYAWGVVFKVFHKD